MRETFVNALISSDYFGLFLSIGLFIVALEIKKKFKLAILNLLLDPQHFSHGKDIWSDQ